MLDEPPLIVRMRGLLGFMDDSFVILQSERSQFRARRLVIRVKNASNPQTFRDLDEHRGVFDVTILEHAEKAGSGHWIGSENFAFEQAG